MFLFVSSRFVGRVEGVGCQRFFETSNFLKVFLPPLTPTQLPGGFHAGWYQNQLKKFALKFEKSPKQNTWIFFSGTTEDLVRKGIPSH